MRDETVDFRKLALEAAAEVYSPRARRCRPWSHVWTMWETDAGGLYQARRCVGCGKEVRRQLARACSHHWETTSVMNLVSPDTRVRHPIGEIHIQRCWKCGDVQRRDLR
ncbi:MAG: hypothetical protein AB7F35_09950 [Acetobacteraceae bacterium]